MRITGKAFPAVRRPEPSLLYGPALLLLLAACGGGGGSAPPPQTGGALLITLAARPQPTGQTRLPEAEPNTDRRPPPTDPPDPTDDDDRPTVPIEVTGGAAASAISGPEITWQARPENVLIRQDEDVIRRAFRVDSTDGAEFDLRYTLGGRDAGLFTIDKATGTVRFRSDHTPDFETRKDYEFSIIARTDGLTITLSKITIPVLNLNEGAAVLRVTGTTEAG